MKSARLFNCARCHSQVFICSRCDRGNIYCSVNCSQVARAEKHRTTNQIYQKTIQGRHKHAQRQRRYRQRQKNKVTEQGSLDPAIDDVVPKKPNEEKKHSLVSIRCHFCGEKVLFFLRHGFLKRSAHHQLPISSSWPLGP